MYSRQQTMWIFELIKVYTFFRNRTIHFYFNINKKQDKE